MRMRLVSTLALWMVVFSTIAAAQQGPAKRVVVRAGKMLDVRTGKMISNPEIVIEGERIVSVGAGGKPDEAGAQVINLPNLTLLPGLIDAHVHITGDPSHFGYQSLGISVPREALYGARYARTTLLAGFTTVRNVAANGYADVALRDAINAGDVPGPRLVVSGPALGITGGHCDNNLLPFEYHKEGEAVADGIAAVQHKVREVIKYGADVIKICATGGVLSKGDDPKASQYTLEEMKAIVAEAHRLGRKVAAHAHGGDGIRLASEAGVDSIEHGSYIDDSGIATLKKNGTWLVPTVYLAEWMAENMDKIGLPPMYRQKMIDVDKAMLENISRAMRSGVKIAFGTDAAVFPHGLNARQFATYVKMGLTPLQAIQSATVSAADLLGWSDRVGSLEAGKYADIIGVEGDPAQNVKVLENVKWVMKGGDVYKP